MEINNLFLEYITNRDLIAIKKHYNVDDYSINNCYAFCLGFAKKQKILIKNEIHNKKTNQYEIDIYNQSNLIKLANRTKSYHLSAYLEGTKSSELTTEIAKDIYNCLFKVDKQYIIKTLGIKNTEFMRMQAFHLGYCVRNNIEIKNNFCLNMQKKLQKDSENYKNGIAKNERKSYIKLYLGINKKSKIY